jgi:hypothetical protein
MGPAGGRIPHARSERTDRLDPGVRERLAMSDMAQRRLRVNPILCDGVRYCAEIVRHAQRAVATYPRLALLLEDVRPERR